MVEYHPQKEDPNRSRLIVGGNIIKYPGDVRKPNADTTTDKIVWNSVVSTTKEKYMYIAIFVHLCTPLTRYEYLSTATNLIKDKIIHQYSLLPLVINGLIYLEIHKIMYGYPN